MEDHHLHSENANNTLQPQDAAGGNRYYTGIDWASLFFRLLENIHWILITALLFAAVTGVYVRNYVTPIYQATSKIYIAGSDTSISLSDLQLGSSLAADYQEAFKIWHVHDMVAERLNLDYSHAQLSSMVSVSSPSGSHILYIDVRSSNPQEAMELADAYAQVAQDFIAEKMELRRPQQIQFAQLPSAPVSPNVGSAVIRAFLIGTVAAALVIILLSLLDDRIRTGDDIEKVTDLATLGILMKQGQKNDAVLPEPLKAPAGPQIAQFRSDLSLGYAGDEAINTIGSAILFAGKNVKRIAITSHDANEGKTFIAVRLACSMAERGMNVLLIDGDLRKASIMGQYRIRNTKKGLAHLLSGQGVWEECIYATNIPHLFLLPAGEAIKTPLPLLSSPDFEETMTRAAAEFDLVIIDTPPIGAVIDAADIAKRCDGSILVLEYNKQTKGTLRHMQRTLAQTQTPIIGCVINKVSAKKLSPYRYYSRYGSDYGYGSENDRKKKKTGTRNKGAKK